MRIRELVLPAADPAAQAEFHAAFGDLSWLRFEPGPAVCSHWAINVPPQRFEEAVEHARERVELEIEEFVSADWRSRAAYFYDPGGNIVELIARERAPGEELFLEISEVGLPVDDVRTAVTFLEEELGLTHFSGDRREFSAVGDDRGLFIVVTVGRPWLFTDRPAPAAPLRVTIAGAGTGTFVVPGSEHMIEVALEA